MVMSEGALHTILVSLQRRCEDTSFAVQMCGMLHRISENEEAAQMLCRDNCVQVLAMLMRTHTHSLSLIKGCCNIVGNLCIDEECSRLVAMPVLFGAVSTSMWLHSKDTSLLLAACSTLTKVRVDDTHSSPPTQGISAISAAIRQHLKQEGSALDPAEQQRIILFTCMALANLCCSEACRLVIASEGGIISIWKALQTYRNDVQIVLYGVTALHRLASSGAIRNLAITDSGAGQLKALFVQHKSQRKILALLLGLLHQLSLSETALQSLARAGLIDMVVGVIRDQASSGDLPILAVCVRVLISAASGKSKETGRILSVTAAHDAAMPVFDTLSSMTGNQHSSRELLVLLAELLSCLAHSPVYYPLLQEVGGMEAIFAHARAWDNDEDLQERLLQVVLAHAPAESAGFLSVEEGTNAVLGIVMRSEEGSSLGVVASNLLFRLMPKEVGQVLDYALPTNVLSSEINAARIPAALPHLDKLRACSSSGGSGGPSRSSVSPASSTSSLRGVPRKLPSLEKKAPTSPDSDAPSHNKLPTGAVSETSGTHSSDSEGDEFDEFCTPTAASTGGAAAQPDGWSVTEPQTGTKRVLNWPPPEHIKWSPAAREPLEKIDPQTLRTRAVAMRKMDCDSLCRLRHVGKSEILVFDNGMAVNSRRLNSEDSTRKPGLSFDASFESANLLRACRLSETEYNLMLCPDTNTEGHTQWFYFAVTNARPGVAYKFNIINMQKKDSLYNDGLRPLFYSQARARREGVGWCRTGSNICYYPNFFPRSKKRPYYTLTFTVSFPHANDTCYLAHCYPYTYTDLQRHLKTLQEDAERRNVLRREVLCTSLAGNRCDLLTITNFPDAELDAQSIFQGKGNKRKRAVLLSARVHPGETNASWIMHGLLDELTSASERANMLRDDFVFVVVPMINPDGVINGNYRCSLAGVDMNRAWEAPQRHVAPPVYYLKRLIKDIKAVCEVLLFCDFHGHSRKRDVFLYGCHCDDDPPMRFHERVFPHVLAQCCPSFEMSSCTFKVQDAKRSTARVVCRSEFGLLNSFTLEASFAGSDDQGTAKARHFRIVDLCNIGVDFIAALHSYSSMSASQHRSTLMQLEQLYSAQPGDDASDSDGSDDDPLDGSMKEEELQALWSVLAAARSTSKESSRATSRASSRSNSNNASASSSAVSSRRPSFSFKSLREARGSSSKGSDGPDLSKPFDPQSLCAHVQPASSSSAPRLRREGGMRASMQAAAASERTAAASNKPAFCGSSSAHSPMRRHLRILREGMAEGDSGVRELAEDDDGDRDSGKDEKLRPSTCPSDSDSLTPQAVGGSRRRSEKSRGADDFAKTQPGAAAGSGQPTASAESSSLEARPLLDRTSGGSAHGGSSKPLPGVLAAAPKPAGAAARPRKLASSLVNKVADKAVADSGNFTRRSRGPATGMLQQLAASQMDGPTSPATSPNKISAAGWAEGVGCEGQSKSIVSRLRSTTGAASPSSAADAIEGASSSGGMSASQSAPVLANQRHLKPTVFPGPHRDEVSTSWPEGSIPSVQVNKNDLQRRQARQLLERKTRFNVSEPEWEREGSREPMGASSEPSQQPRPGTLQPMGADASVRRVSMTEPVCQQDPRDPMSPRGQHSSPPALLPGGPRVQPALARTGSCRNNSVPTCRPTTRGTAPNLRPLKSAEGLSNTTGLKSLGGDGETDAAGTPTRSGSARHPCAARCPISVAGLTHTLPVRATGVDKMQGDSTSSDSGSRHMSRKTSEHSLKSDVVIQQATALAKHLETGDKNLHSPKTLSRKSSERSDNSNHRTASITSLSAAGGASSLPRSTSFMEDQGGSASGERQPLPRKSSVKSGVSMKSGSAKSDDSFNNSKKGSRGDNLMRSLPEDHDDDPQSISRVGSMAHLSMDHFADERLFGLGGLSKRASFFGTDDIFGSSSNSMANNVSRTASFRAAQSSMRTVSMARLDPKGVLAPVRERQVSLKLDPHDTKSHQARAISAAGERILRNRQNAIEAGEDPGDQSFLGGSLSRSASRSCFTGPAEEGGSPFAGMMQRAPNLETFIAGEVEEGEQDDGVWRPMSRLSSFLLKKEDCDDDDDESSDEEDLLIDLLKHSAAQVPSSGISAVKGGILRNESGTS
jgi:hypothetical protein